MKTALLVGSIIVSQAFALFVKNKTHIVVVGATGLSFDPPSLYINVGDKVIWQFPSTTVKHAVVKADASVSNPCQKASKGEFDSGALYYPATFSKTFHKEEFIRYFCDMPFHCYLGMQGNITVGSPALPPPPTPPPEPKAPPPPKVSEPIPDGKGNWIYTVVAGTIDVVNGFPLLQYTPSTLTISTGDSVKWLFSEYEKYTVTESIGNNSCTPKPNGFDSGLLWQPQEFIQKFDNIGEFEYISNAPAGPSPATFCSVAGMKGKIIVENSEYECYLK